MSKTQCSDSTRSVSDGDLTNSSSTNAKDFMNDECCVKHSPKQTFFTLPRWMSGRKRDKNRIKYIKVDVPFNSSGERNVISKDLEDKKNIDRPSNFVGKLFRRSSFFNGASSSRRSYKKQQSKVPVSQIMSSSNTDIRSNNIIFHSFDYHEYFRDKIPAVCGIKNHGNTCFMNSVIQCLSNTDTFAEYFVMDLYKMDVLRRNKVHSKKYGTRGEVTEQLAVLLKSLWSCQYYSNISNKFKNLVSKFGSQYEGNEQHDAQEFLLWLLDKVHEDLNTASKQKYKKPKGSYGRTDEEIAAEMLANHLRCNNSFVQDLFQGQFRSSLCCLGCGRISNTFDPYLCISVPIPHYQVIPIFLHLVYLNQKNVIKVGLLMDSDATIADVCEKLCSNYGLSKQEILLMEILNGEILRTFKKSEAISSLKDSIGLYVLEIPEQTVENQRELEKIVLVISCCIEADETEHEEFWKPLVLEIYRESSYREVQLQILQALTPIITGTIDLETELPFSLLVITGNSNYDVLCSSVDMPFYMPAIDQALVNLNEKGPKYLRMILVWEKYAEYLLERDMVYVEEHVSVAAVKNNKKVSDEVSLYECFDTYFNEERLGVEDAWMCPCCHHRLPSVKQLSLWTVPDILIVHLKRFRQSSTQRVKITTFVEYPYSGLDMHPYVASRNISSSQPSHNTVNSLTFWSPWKRSRSRPYVKSEEFVYDLYAVCNHHGNMQSGHYTACCRNPIDSRWYLFDDTNVHEIQASEAISSDAYILFYQRSSLSSVSCASSSSGYSSASSNCSVAYDHWAFRMPFILREPITSKSQDNLYDVGNTSSLDRRVIPKTFNRTSRSYSTLPHFTDEKVCTTPKGICESPSLVDSHNYKSIIPPPPPPSTKHYWTVTSV